MVDEVDQANWLIVQFDKADLDNNVPEGEASLTLEANFLNEGVQKRLSSTATVTVVEVGRFRHATDPPPSFSTGADRCVRTVSHSARLDFARTGSQTRVAGAAMCASTFGPASTERLTMHPDTVAVTP